MSGRGRELQYQDDDIMSMGEFSDIVIADKSSKFLRTVRPTVQQPQQRRNRLSQYQNLSVMRQPTGISNRSRSTTSLSSSGSAAAAQRSSIPQDDYIRLRSSSGNSQRQPPPPATREISSLESMFLQAKPTDSRNFQTETTPRTSNTGGPDSGTRTSSRPINSTTTATTIAIRSSKSKPVLINTRQRRNHPRKKATKNPVRKASSPNTSSMGSKLKKLNCFGGSRPKENDHLAMRQQQQQQRAQQRNTKSSSSNNNESLQRVLSVDTSDLRFPEEDALSPAGMSVMTTATKDLFKNNNPTKTNSGPSTQPPNRSQSNTSSNSSRKGNGQQQSNAALRPTLLPSRSRSSTKDILDELMDKEDELKHRFIGLSVSDIEEKFEQRKEETSSSTSHKQKTTSPKSKDSDRNSPQNSHQSNNSNRQQPKQQQQQQNGATSDNQNQIRKSQDTSEERPQQNEDSSQQNKQPSHRSISAHASIVHGRVTPPRGAVSTSWMMKTPQPKQQGPNTKPFVDSPSIHYHSAGSSSGMGTHSSTSVVNLAKEQQKQVKAIHELAPKRPPQDQSITPRCHFCGGPHWIYNCPHMDESSEGREKRRRQSRHRTLTKNRHYPDDESQESGSSIDGSRNTSGYTTLTGATSDGGVCAQSNPFQCQICFGFR